MRRCVACTACICILLGVCFVAFDVYEPDPPWQSHKHDEQFARTLPGTQGRQKSVSLESVKIRRKEGRAKEGESEWSAMSLSQARVLFPTLPPTELDKIRSMLHSKSAPSSLTEAAVKGDAAAAKRFINSGSHIEEYDKLGNTPLNNAAYYGHKAVAELLIDKKADINAVGKYEDFYPSQKKLGEMIGIIHEAGESVRFGSTPLNKAAYKGNEAVAQLLIAKKAAINQWDNSDGNTPLFNAAAVSGHLAVTRLLLNHSATVDKKNYQGFTALAELSCNTFDEHVPIAKMLIEHRADVNIKTLNGWTPLECAADAIGGSPKVNMGKLLVIAGADLEVVIKDDLQYAEQQSRSVNWAALESVLVSQYYGKVGKDAAPLSALALLNGHPKLSDTLLQRMLAEQGREGETIFSTRDRQSLQQVLLYVCLISLPVALVIIGRAYCTSHEMGKEVSTFVKSMMLLIFNFLFLYVSHLDAFLYMFSTHAGWFYIAISPKVQVLPLVRGLVILHLVYACYRLVDWKCKGYEALPGGNNSTTLINSDAATGPSATATGTTTASTGTVPASFEAMDVFENWEGSLLMAVVIFLTQTIFICFYVSYLCRKLVMDDRTFVFWATGILVQLVLISQLENADETEEELTSSDNETGPKTSPTPSSDDETGPKTSLTWLEFRRTLQHTFGCFCLSNRREKLWRAALTANPNQSRCCFICPTGMEIRYFLSMIANNLYSGIILLTLPIFLAPETSIIDFVKDAFATTFIMELDNLAVERKIALLRSRVKLTTSPGSPEPRQTRQHSA